MNSPLVSVCITAYNHEKYIRTCLASVLAQQSDLSLEILISDDKSTDGTAEIIKKFVSDNSGIIKFFPRKVRLGGASKHYPLLLQEARGKYIAHLDGDDYWLPGKLATQIKFLEEHLDCPAVYCNALVVNDDNIPLGFFNNNLSQRQFSLNDLVIKGNFLNHSSILYRAYMKEGIIKMQPPFLDYKINLNHAQKGNIGYINQVLSVYRYASASSIIANANERVRALYWDSLISLPREKVSSTALAFGMAEFMRSVFFRSIRIKKPSLFFQWVPVVFSKTPKIFKLIMPFLIILSIIRISMDMFLSFMARIFSGSKFIILYKR